MPLWTEEGVGGVTEGGQAYVPTGTWVSVGGVESDVEILYSDGGLCFANVCRSQRCHQLTCEHSSEDHYVREFFKSSCKLVKCLHRCGRLKVLRVVSRYAGVFVHRRKKCQKPLSQPICLKYQLILSCYCVEVTSCLLSYLLQYLLADYFTAEE